MVSHPRFLARLRRHWLSVVALFIPLALWITSILLPRVPELYEHILLTLTAVMGVHVLDRLFLIRDTEDALESLMQRVVQPIQSLDAMSRCGVVQIYASRSEAMASIRRDLEDPGNSKIRLIGISLNDFVGMGAGQEAWEAVEAFVRGARRIGEQSRGLDIRVLLIDPRSFGARLRSEAEARAPGAPPQRLLQDVHYTADYLRNLAAAASPATTGVTIECRLYRTPPIFFLCLVDSACYVQQYHFWSSRDDRVPVPTLKFCKEAVPAGVHTYHQEMEDHFDWVWDNASVPVEEYLVSHVVGTDEGINQCGTINVYTDHGEARRRMEYLLDQAKTKVSIQGVSLRSFLERGSLCDSVYRLVERGKVRVEMLLLDPDSEQAKYRSYRERLLDTPDQGYQEYLDKDLHRQSQLYRDTLRTIERIWQMVGDIRKNKDPAWVSRLSVKLYASAPACFVLRVDERVLVEQYHYGKVSRGRVAILGSEMPLVEYRRCPTHLYETSSDPLRRPYDLLVDHLDHAFVLAREVH